MASLVAVLVTLILTRPTLRTTALEPDRPRNRPPPLAELVLWVRLAMI